MDDVVGYNFAVIGDPAVVAAVDDNVRDVWRQIGTTVMTEHSAGLESWLAEHSATAAIVRPDRYTFALAADAAELAQATMALRERIGFVGAPR
jgi:3-(3-hydroxy-phenyl)propionate hydroxylase